MYPTKKPHGKPPTNPVKPSQKQIKDAVFAKVSYTKIPSKEANEAESRNLTKAGEKEIAADLCFSTCSDFHKWLESPFFKPYWEELQQWKQDHGDLRMDKARPKAYFGLLDDLVSKPQAKQTQIDRAYFEGMPGTEWKNQDFFLSTLLRIFMANKDVSEYGYDIGPFPRDLPQERWHKLWNVIQWCRTKNFFTEEGRAAADKRSHINVALTRPWYMQARSDSEWEGPEHTERAASDTEDDTPCSITWLDMPVSEEKTGLMVESNVNLPAFCEFSSYENFKQHVAMKFQLQERSLKVGELFFIIEDGPQASLAHRKVAVYWESLFTYQLQGYKMSFFLTSVTLKQIDLESPVRRTNIPHALVRKYQYASDGLIERRNPDSNVPAKRRQDAIDSDGAVEISKRTRHEELVPENSSCKSSIVPEFEQPYLRNEQILRRADELPDGDKVSDICGEEPDLEDDPLVEDDDEPLCLSTDEENERDDESNDSGDDRLSEGLNIPDDEESIKSHFDLAEDSDYVDEGTSSAGETDRETPPDEEARGRQEVLAGQNSFHRNDTADAVEASQSPEHLKSQNAFHQGKQSAEVESAPSYASYGDQYQGVDGPRKRRRSEADSQCTTDLDVATKSGEVQQSNAQDSPTQDVRDAELGTENQFRLHDSNGVAQKQIKPSEKLKASLEILGRLLEKYNYSEETLIPALLTTSGRREVQKQWTDAVQLATDCPCEPHRAQPTQETLDASAAIANMRFTGKYFEDEDDVNEFWERYWSLLRAASGVDQDDVGPNLTLSAEILQLQDKYVPGMAGLIPRPAQLSGAAWLFAKEQESGSIRSTDGKYQYQTMPTLGGIVCDIPGGGKTLMSIMHHQNIINRMPPAGGVYMPSMYIVPKIAIGQWYDCFKNNAPEITVFVIWGKSNFRKTADWMAANVSTKDLENGPENVPERLKFAFDTTDRRAASVAFLITTQTCESRFKDPSPWVGRFARCFIDEAHSIKDPDASISKVVRGFQFKYRHLITATPMINDKSDIIGLADFLYRPEWAQKYGFDEDFDVFDPEISLADSRVLCALSKKKIKAAFGDLPQHSGVSAGRELLAQEFKRLREIMPKIVQSVQLRRANGTKLPVGDGTYVIMGDDLPPYEAITVDLCMESSAAEEYAVYSEYVSKEYNRRARAYAATKRSKSSETISYPFPFDLQRILQLSSTSPLLKRFMDNLPSDSTLVPGLGLMRKHGIDHRFLVERAYSAESLPKDRLETLKAMLYGCPKGRYLLKLLRHHIIVCNEKKVLIFVDVPVSGQYVEWMLKAMHYHAAFMDSNVDETTKAKMVADFNDENSDLEVLITTYRIGAQAVDLQAHCSTVILFEPGVNTNMEIQAIGRIRRPGQQKPQTVYRFYVENTFNRYQELKSLYKRMGEQASWGGNDVQAALATFVSQLEGFDDDRAYFEAVRRFDRHLKGQTREDSKAEKLRAWDRVVDIRDLVKELREKATVV
ncbi:hypothetical protein LTR67_006523 [Exophiala xenobiotica]